MQSEESRVIFTKLDRHDERIRELESTGKVTDHRLTQAEKNYHEICNQLVSTETKVMQSIIDIATKQDKLIEEQNRRQGASDTVKWIWGILGATLVVLQIYQVFK